MSIQLAILINGMTRPTSEAFQRQIWTLRNVYIVSHDTPLKTGADEWTIVIYGDFARTVDRLGPAVWRANKGAHCHVDVLHRDGDSFRPCKQFTDTEYEAFLATQTKAKAPPVAQSIRRHRAASPTNHLAAA